MVIQYYGLSFFKIQFGDTVLALNPVSKSSKHKSASFGADVALVSTNHPDMNGVDTIGRGEKNPFLITGPGEYEVGGIRIHGFPTKSRYGGAQHNNTVYLIHLEDMHLLYLGALDGELAHDALEELENVDVLFTPIGGNGVLDAKFAHKLGVQLEARIIIPMLYNDSALKMFLKDEAEHNGKPVDKLTLKQKDLSDKEGHIIVLDSAQ